MKGGRCAPAAAPGSQRGGLNDKVAASNQAPQPEQNRRGIKVVAAACPACARCTFYKDRQQFSSTCVSADQMRTTGRAL